ncbi:MAG TPA: formylglycine-generating enzyme family protein [Planctomycetota bacterium]|nr:formylglycine-generating enzyme family protein [Planctomycetota bacterium]
MTEAADQPTLPGEPAAKHHRSLTVFYAVMCAAIVVGLFSFWFWRTWTVWWFDADEAKKRQSAAAGRLRVPVEMELDLGGGVKMEFVLVPAGRFRMGSPAEEVGRRDDERLHWVTIARPFYMGKYEVTQEQWEKVTGVNYSDFSGPKNPAERVSWDGCQAFLQLLNQLPALAPGPAPSGKGDGARARLPTEAEWEWACRAGTRSQFCSGDADASLADYAWFHANSGNTTHPVGEKKPNAWGLFDMHGNVAEWCNDWYREYVDGGWASQLDPAGPATGSSRVVRGGSWVHNTNGCRAARRGTLGPQNGDCSRGFRVVMVPARH